MKTKIIFTVLCLSFAALEIKAKEIKPLPPVTAPRELVEIGSEYAEGTVTRLTARDVEVFLPWAQNAQAVLTKALTDIESMPIDQQVRHLSVVMKSVVRRSGEKNYQLFMRFSLNRAMLLVSELLKEANVSDRGIMENALDIQIKSIRVALDVHESDLAYQRRVAAGEATTQLEYAKFGLNFGRSMLKAIDSILDASAQYRLLFKTLEIMNWDLSRDAAAAENADIIIDIYNTLTVMNEHPTGDDRASITDIRRLNVLRAMVDTASTTVIYASTGSAQALKAGDKVYYNKQLHTVIGADSRGKYALKQMGYYETIVNNVDRAMIYAGSGCNGNLCVGDSVIVVKTKVDAKIVGINPAGEFTLQGKDYYETVSIDIASNLAKKSGCINTAAGRLCVGQKVVYGSAEQEIKAIQPDGKFILEANDYYNTRSINVDPRNVVPVVSTRR